MSKTVDEQTALDAMVKEIDAKLVKDMIKLLNRVERIFVPSTKVTYNPIVEKLETVRKLVQQGKYIEDMKEFSRINILNVLSKNSEAILRKVDWNTFQHDLISTISEGNKSFVLPNDVQMEIDTEVRLHEEKVEKATKKEKLRQLQVSNRIYKSSINVINTFLQI
jgi:hypothetical protein